MIWQQKLILPHLKEFRIKYVYFLKWQLGIWKEVDEQGAIYVNLKNLT
jgi:hypothetical protein